MLCKIYMGVTVAFVQMLFS